MQYRITHFEGNTDLARALDYPNGLYAVMYRDNVVCGARVVDTEDAHRRAKAECEAMAQCLDAAGFPMT